MENNEPYKPPKWADDFLKWYCSPKYIEEVQGDLHEVFYQRCREKGVTWASFLFIVDVFRSMTVRQIDSSFSSFFRSAPILRNYLTIARRSLIRNKVFSLVNIFGLSIGLAACFFIMQYVMFERSYDRFHKNADQIFRVVLEGKSGLSAASHPGVGPAMKADFPEVEEYARMVHQSIIWGDNVAVSYENEQGDIRMFNESRIYDVDPSFLKMFSFPFISGDPENALEESSSIVISESVSKKFFGDQDPIGKRLLIFARFPFIVSGVFQDIPENSHIKFDILMATYMKNRLENLEGSWKWSEFYTYIRLKPFSDPKQLAAKFPDFMQKYLGGVREELNFIERLHLQPLTDIHLKSPFMFKEREVHGSERTVHFMTVVAILILVTAWINYINLSTSRSLERAKEVGLRKVAGASRSRLIVQFLFESALMNFLSILMAIMLIIVAAPYFNQLVGKNIVSVALLSMKLNESWFWLGMACAFVFGSFCAGLYPAFVLSSFKVTNILKGKFSRSQSGIIIRKALVGSQFVVSAGLIAGMIIVFRQVSFMRDQEPGYRQEQLLIIKTPLVIDTTFHQKLKFLKTELRRNPNVLNITPSNEIPGKMISQVNLIRNRDESPEHNSPVYHLYIDTDFIDTYGIGLIAGRNFNEDEELPSLTDLTTHPVPVIVNEKVVKTLGYNNAAEAVSQLITFGWGARRDWVGEIVGVVSNHHQRSLREDFDPILFFPVTRPTAHLSGQYVTVSLRMQHASETLSFIKEQYALVFPGKVFEYFFLDDYFDQQYKADEQFGKVFGLFSCLAIIVASLGLFGLSTFTISQRVKEIAVRRVLGATIQGMVILFSRDFIRLIAIANLIALPIVYLLADHWLDNFAFRVSVGWTMFVVPALLLLIISLATVSIQTAKTGMINPVNSLRSE